MGNPSQLVRCSLEYDHKNTLITLTHIYTTTKNGHATGLMVFWELYLVEIAIYFLLLPCLWFSCFAVVVIAAVVVVISSSLFYLLVFHTNRIKLECVKLLYCSSSCVNKYVSMYLLISNLCYVPFFCLHKFR